jgi:AMP deaminase
LVVLNRLRERLGYTLFPLKPHAGEAGAWHHLASAFLLADSVNHGIELSHSPPLQYHLRVIMIMIGTLD